MTHRPTAAAVLVAAGTSTRMGGTVRKPHLALAGRSILEHACAAFAELDEVTELVLVVHPDDIERITDLARTMPPLAKVRAVVRGGDSRTASVRAGVSAVSPGIEVIAVHDAARPLIRPEIIRQALQRAASDGAALVAVPVSDTLKSVPDGTHAATTLDRSTLWAAQTPQVFRAQLLRDLLERARHDTFVPTDDAALHERYVGPVPLVRGDPTNIKITTPDDLAIAEAILAQRARTPRA